MFDGLMNQARAMLDGAAPGDVAAATQDHVQQTDPQELADHLTQGAEQMDQPQRASLAQTVLGALSAHGGGAAAANDAGVDTAAAQQGDQGSLVALIQHASSNPDALRDAAVQYVERDPRVLAQLPGLLQGVMARLGA